MEVTFVFICHNLKPLRNSSSPTSKAADAFLLAVRITIDDLHDPFRFLEELL